MFVLSVCLFFFCFVRKSRQLSPIFFTKQSLRNNSFKISYYGLEDYIIRESVKKKILLENDQTPHFCACFPLWCVDYIVNSTGAL